jgi:uncharacterized protein YjeT (DUF2065 family)
VNINNKILMAIGLVLVFLISSIFSSKFVFRLQDLSQVFGLGGVAAGYFITKILKK